MGILVLIIGLIVRISISFATISFGKTMNLKEKLLVSLAWVPKATVQAALGPLALDRAKAMGSEDKTELIEYGETVLSIAVLVILVTAPIGAITIRFLGSKWLSKEAKTEDTADKDSEE